MNATRAAGSVGACTFTETASIACALPAPSSLLRLSVRRAAVVKSGVFRFNITNGSLPKRVGTSCSTVAPLGMRPALGTLTLTREPSLPSTPKPLTSTLPCAIA